MRHTNPVSQLADALDSNLTWGRYGSGTGYIAELWQGIRAHGTTWRAAARLAAAELGGVTTAIAAIVTPVAVVQRAGRELTPRQVESLLLRVAGETVRYQPEVITR